MVRSLIGRGTWRPLGQLGSLVVTRATRDVLCLDPFLFHKLLSPSPSARILEWILRAMAADVYIALVGEVDMDDRIPPRVSNPRLTAFRDWARGRDLSACRLVQYLRSLRRIGAP